MPLIATFPMYDWPETRAETDARWARLRAALVEEGFDAPMELTRADDHEALWLSPELLVGETCSHPLATTLAGRVRYVATPVHQAEGCTPGTYRSAIVRRGTGHKPAPAGPEAALDPACLEGRFAANSEHSLSGFVALQRDTETLPAEVLWTGSHRASTQAIANGNADFAAIDCVTWEIAKHHEQAARKLHVVGWTTSRPALPLITSLAFDEEDLLRIRRAVMLSMDAVVLAEPTGAA